jgi:hypothetical protein
MTMKSSRRSFTRAEHSGTPDDAVSKFMGPGGFLRLKRDVRS